MCTKWLWSVGTVFCIHFVYWLSDLVSQLNSVNGNHSEASAARLHDATSSEPSARGTGGGWGVHVLCLCSARRPLSVLLRSEPPDRTVLIQAWQQINKMYSLRIIVGGYEKKMSVELSLTTWKGSTCKRCQCGLTSPDFGINKQQSGHRA